MSKTKHDDEPVASPCVRNCCLDQNDVCLGCFRSLEEIIAWGTADNEARRRIVASAKNRQQDTVQRRGSSQPKGPNN